MSHIGSLTELKIAGGTLHATEGAHIIISVPAIGPAYMAAYSPREWAQKRRANRPAASPADPNTAAAKPAAR